MDEVLRTLVYGSTSGLLHVGTSLMSLASVGSALPETIVFNKVIDSGGSRELSEGLMDAAEGLGNWIGNVIVKVKKWR